MLQNMKKLREDDEFALEDENEFHKVKELL